MHLFSKHLQFLDDEEMPESAVEMGLDSSGATPRTNVGRFEQRWYHRASETHRTLVSLVRVWNPKRVNTAGDAARELQGSTQAIHDIIRTEE